MKIDRDLKLYASLALWLVYAGHLGVATWLYGWRAASCLIGLVFFFRLKPSVLRLPAPMGTYTLVRYRWHTGWAIVSAYLVGCTLLAKYFFGRSNGFSTTFDATATLGGVMLFALVFLLTTNIVFLISPWTLEYFAVKKGQSAKASNFEILPSDKSRVEYLWMPDGEALLISHSGDTYPRLHVFDLGSGMREVTYKTDWGWLEPLWQAHGLTAESFIRENARSIIEQLPAEPRDYGDQLRKFFCELIPWCSGFPRWEIETFDRNAISMYEHAMSQIPPESHFFDDLARRARVRIESLDSQAVPHA